MDQSSEGEQFTYRPEQESQPSAVAPTAAAQQPVQPVAANNAEVVSWQASEFVDHQKNASWFLPLVIGGVLTSGLMYFITRSILSSLVVFLGVSAFLMLARQKPRTLTYVINNAGITIGAKRYAFDDFRTFSIMQEGALYSIFLEPIKRFMPPLSIYFAPEDGEKIFDILAAHMPHQERTADPVERLMKRIRF